MMTVDLLNEGANIQPNDLINQMAELEVNFHIQIQGIFNILTIKS